MFEDVNTFSTFVGRTWRHQSLISGAFNQCFSEASHVGKAMLGLDVAPGLCEEFLPRVRCSLELAKKLNQNCRTGAETAAAEEELACWRVRFGAGRKFSPFFLAATRAFIRHQTPLHSVQDVYILQLQC